MYNTYVSSSLSIKCKGPLSVSFNDYSYFPNDRFDRNPMPISSPSCCACCSNSICKVPISPSFLYGLRQSTLIHWSASRRLIWGRGERCYNRFPVHDMDRGCCSGHARHLKERSDSGSRGRWGERRFRCMVLEENSGRHRSCDFNDAEIMLSLLTDEVSQECLSVRERKCSISRSVEVEKRGSGGGGTLRKKKKNVGLGLLESNSKCELEASQIKSRREDYREKEERRKEDEKIFLRGENQRARKAGSSCSSYYSCSSLGELESDTEVQIKQQGYGEESTSGLKIRRDSEESGEVMYDREIVEEVKKHGDVAGSYGIVMEQEKTAVGSYATSSVVERDWRNKSEKKLSEVSTAQTESRKESSQKQSRVKGVHEADHHQTFSSDQQIDDVQEKSNVVISVADGRRENFNQKATQITEQSESRTNYKHFTGLQEKHGTDMKAVTSLGKHFNARKENSSAAGSLVQETINESTRTVGRISHQDDYRRNSQHLGEVSEVQEINIKGTSAAQRQSEARVKKQGDGSIANLSSVQDAKESHHIAGRWDSRRADSGKELQQLTEVSDRHDVHIKNTAASLRQYDTRMKKQADDQNFIRSSSSEAKEQHYQRGQKAIRKTESRKGVQDMSNVLLVHSSDAQVTDTQRVSKRICREETYSESVMKSAEETVKRNDLSEGRVCQIGSGKETSKPSKALSFREGTSKQASSSHASLILKTQPTVQHIGTGIVEKSNSGYVEPTTDFAVQEVSSASLEIGPDTQLRHVSTPASGHEEPLNFISPEDVLGSADRLQKSSMHFVGEFVEKATQEVLTSKVIQKETRVSEVLVNEGHKYQKKSLSHYGSGDLKSKERDSRRSSWSSGVKGPSDEIWDVTDPSIQEPAETEAPQSTTTTIDTVSKRTGRSLWNVISDVVRLRWVSRSESHNSTQKSFARSSPNQSASSETWFSDHEPDESSDENMKRLKRSTSAEQHQLVKVSSGSQGEASISARSKDETSHVGDDVLSTPSISERGSASKGPSSVSAEGNFGRCGTAMVESSVSMPSLRIRRSPCVDEISIAGKTSVSTSGSLVQEQSTGLGLTEASGTEGKDGEMKWRKLQRTNQVQKDRFDEWEEAYKVESEQRKIDEMFMKEALLEAKKAADMWEVPVGAVLVQNGKIIARGCNLVEELRDSTAHAEMICIREASNLLRTWRLSETTLYVTLEPCPMCAGAILQARVDTVVWGAPNKLLGADGSWIRLFPNGGEGGSSLESTDGPPAPVHPFHPKIVIRRGVLATECADVMQQFFQLRRRKKEKKPDSPTAPSCLPISHHPSKVLSKMHDVFHFMFCL